MANKRNTISCRLSDGDYEKLHIQAEVLEVTPSDYIRYLIRIPLASKDDRAMTHAVVLDKDALSGIQGELVRWGHHYNQGVRALNTAALFAERGSSNVDHFLQQIGTAANRLEKVNDGCKAVLNQVQRLEYCVLIEG